ncbi:MAG: hypothetical protein COB67_11570 [SAR324 cluster bacterium]|uniref:Uncharacterized protein n=1 Tax=SAR324 cluster bacterium TaxID=2024889 RepID=A0A2A4ST52_9DELT|nr:MAG: hypothetical protein COB67_11570 [SAR324 cluster bacterium]
MLYNTAKLGDQDLKMIQEFEKKLGRPVLAFSGQDYQPASLTETQMKEIKDLEKKLDLCLVALS